MTDPDRFVRHGPIQVSPKGPFLAHQDGTPFFFLSDTAWNGAILSTEEDWQAYLDDRAAKRFTAIQFITHASWTAALTNLEGLTAFTSARKPAINPDFFNRIDRRIEMINARGLLAVPVLAWAANFGHSARLNVGHTQSADTLIELLRYQINRFARHHVMWVLAGDGNYNCLRARKWKRVGRALFDRNNPSIRPKPRDSSLGRHSTDTPLGPLPLVTLHPQGFTWPWNAFASEPWIDLITYQSGHSDHPRHLKWHHSGPPAQFWRTCNKPIINLEPVYEGIAPGRKPFDNAAVRRAIYWSLLCSPTAGVSYGAHGVWSWTTTPGEVLNHIGMGQAQPWRQAMNFAGSQDMQQLALIFSTIDWWRLRPAPNLLLNQPFPKDPARHVAISASENHGLVLAYLPAGGQLDVHQSIAHLNYQWINPTTGKRMRTTAPLRSPDNTDWLLLGTS